MPRLPDETAIQSIQPRSVDTVVTGTPDPIGGASSAFAGGMQQLGRGIGAVGAAIGEQQSDADRYNAENELIRLEKEHRRFLDEQKSKAAGDPKGFADSSRKAFDERANSIYSNAPPRLQPIIKNRLQTMDGSFYNEASNFENTRRDAHFGKEVSDTLDGLRGDVANDPAKHAEVRERGLALIQSSPLSTAAKEKLIEAWKSGAATSAIVASLQRDPEGTRSALGFGVNSGIVDRIIGVESGGKANAKNPRSTATGLGQFTEGTWMAFIRETMPGEASDRENALALRNDPDISKKAVDWYARKNARDLRAAGFPDTPGNIYLAHFAGPGGAKAILGADPSASAASVLGDAVVAANPFLAGKTVGWVKSWADKKMTGVSMEPTASFAQDISEDQRQAYGRQADRTYSVQQAQREREAEAARDRAIREAEAAAEQARAEAQRAADQQKIESRAALSQLKRDMADDIASAERTGKGFDEERLSREKIARVAGEEAAVGWERSRARAFRVHGAMKGIETLPDQDMDERLKRLEPVPGSEGFDADQEAYNAAERRVERVRKARAADPALAVEAIESVKEARKSAQYEDVGGKRSITPQSAQAIIKARLDGQNELGIQSPLAVTRTEAREIARNLRAIGEDNEDGVEVFMRKLRGTYGRYAEDVLSSTLFLQGVNKNLSNVATEVLGKIAMSIPPTPADMRRLERATMDAAMETAMQGKAPPQAPQAAPKSLDGLGSMSGFTPEYDQGPVAPRPLRPGKEVGGTLVQTRPDGTRVNYVKELIEGRVSDFDFDNMFNAGDGESAAAKIRRQYAARTKGELAAPGLSAPGGQ